LEHTRTAATKPLPNKVSEETNSEGFRWYGAAGEKGAPSSPEATTERPHEAAE
jgi:hypothetical protein